MQNDNRQAKNSKARIRANDRYNKANYKNISIRVKPDQADEIRATAEKLHQSLAQLIVNAVRAYTDIQTAGADPAQPEPEKPEIVTTKSPMESGETAGAQPEETEEKTENEIEEEENQTAGAETTAGEEEPQEDEDEDEDEKPEEMPAFVWEQIQRLKKADKRHTAERKAREAAERKRRRLGDIED